MKLILCLACGAIACLPVSAADVVPAERLIDWQTTAGVRGGIPQRTAVHVTLSPGGGDDRPAIQAALDSCPPDGVVRLAAGTFRLASSEPLSIPHRRVLRGEGASTILLLPAENTSLYGIQLYGPYAGWMDVPLASGAARGSTQATLTEPRFADQIAAGRKLLFNCENDPALIFPGYNGAAPSRCQTQWVEVTAWDPAARRVTFEPPLFLDYPASRAPAVRTVYSSVPGRNFLERAGVENLVIRNERPERFANLLLSWTSECWLRDVISEGGGVSHLWLFDAFRCEVRRCRFEGVLSPLTSGRGYGIQHGTPNNPAPPNTPTGTLIEDNAFSGLRGSILIGYGSSGGVIAYNYFHNSRHDPPHIQIFDILSHTAFPHMWLIEGNVGHGMTLDNTAGNSHWMTVHRNWWRGKEAGRTAQLASFQADAYNRFATATGNVFGYDGIMEDLALLTSPTGRAVYSEEAPQPMTYSHSWRVYVLGYGTPGGQGGVHDTGVASTLIRRENFNYLHRTIPEAERLSAGESLPSSRLHASAPPYFGGLPWPPIDPVLPPGANTPAEAGRIPAARRFLGMPAPGALPVPADLRVLATAVDHLEIGWTTAAAGAWQHIIERAPASATSAFAEVGRTSMSRFTDTGLTAGSLHRYRVRVEKDGLRGEPSAELLASTLSAGPPAPPAPAPSQLTATWNPAIGVVLQWQAPSGGTPASYAIERLQPGGAPLQLGTTTLPHFADRGVDSGQAWSYQVRTVDGAGEAVSAPAAIQIPPADPTAPPPAPTLLLSYQPSRGVTLSWDSQPFPKNTQFIVERATGHQPTPFAELARTAGSSYNDKSPEPGVLHWYRVRPLRPDGAAPAWTRPLPQEIPQRPRPPTGLRIR